MNHLHLDRVESRPAAGRQTGYAEPLLGLVDRAADHGALGMNALASRSWGSLDWYMTRVAVHEAGHLVIAQHFGLDAVIHLDTKRPGNGHCSISGRRPGGVLEQMHVRKMIGLAGSAAAQIGEYGSCAAGPWVHRHIGWPDCASPSDLSLAGAFTLDDVERCCALVRRCWPAIARKSRLVLADAMHGQAR